MAPLSSQLNRALGRAANTLVSANLYTRLVHIARKYDSVADQKKRQKGPLSNRAIIGIACGGVTLLLLIGFFIWHLVRRASLKKRFTGEGKVDAARIFRRSEKRQAMAEKREKGEQENDDRMPRLRDMKRRDSDPYLQELRDAALKREKARIPPSWA